MSETNDLHIVVMVSIIPLHEDPCCLTNSNQVWNYTENTSNHFP